MSALPRDLAACTRLHLGQPVHLNVGASWLAGTVTALAPSHVAVSYLNGTAPVRVAVPPWVVRPADGIALRDVQLLTSGDEVVFSSATYTVAAAPWQGRDGSWIVSYTNGQRASVPAGAVLRVVDYNAAVTVHGQPLADALTALAEKGWVS